MSLRIDLSPAALADVMGIAEYLAEQSSFDTSDRFLRSTEAAYRQLAGMSGMGSPRDYGPEFPGLRMWPVPGFPNYLIFYQATDEELSIRRIINGAQDIETIFSAPNV